jgi:iron complex transport system substrate-binding protein
VYAHPVITRTAAFLALIASAGAVSACGASRDEPSASTRPYVDAAGRTVQLPDAPKRIVVLSEPALDAALALGVRPVATTLGRGQGTVSAYLQARAKGIQSVGILAQPNLERIARLRPELILTDGTATLDDATLDKLRRLAPTVVVSRTGEDWRRAFSATARILGRSAQAQRLLARYDRRVAAIRARLGANSGATISIVRWGGIGLPAVLMKELAASRVLTDLGLRRPPAQDRRGPGHTVPVSLERIEALDADWMFFGSLGAGGPAGGVADTPADLASARQALRYARDTPGFTGLKAVRSGHVVPVDGSVWTSAGGYLAEQVVLDDVERALIPAAR